MTHQKTKAEVPIGRDPKRATDQVKEDGVMKELIRKENKTRRDWEDRWGFMKNKRKMCMEEAERRGMPKDLFQRQSSRPSSPQPPGNMKLKDSRKISEKSSGMIGWRSSVRENDYNRFVGPMYISAKSTMNPPLSEDEPDLNRQCFIFLG